MLVTNGVYGMGYAQLSLNTLIKETLVKTRVVGLPVLQLIENPTLQEITGNRYKFKNFFYYMKENWGWLYLPWRKPL